MIFLAPAKINLFLKITGKDEKDGYHFIYSLFDPVSLYDRLDFKIINKKGIFIDDKLKKLKIKKEKNLIYKAAKLIYELKNIQKGIKITFYKNIPDGSGLGGGSSDAAITLIALNKIFKLNLTKKKLLELAKKLGSDVPFFIYGKRAYVSGKGDCIRPVSNKKKYWYIIVVPELKISTKDAYNWYDKQAKKMLTYNKNNIIINKSKLNYNDFENVLLKKYNVLKIIKKELQKYSNNGKVSLSGSGSSIFALFETKKEAISCFKTVKRKLKNCSIYFASSI